MKINRVEDIRIFVMAADAGSFSEVARRLGISPMAVSAIVKRLEASLGQRLFERSTRRVRLSEAGERLLPHVREALQAVADAEAVLAGDSLDSEGLSGPMRISLPSDLARVCVLDWIEAFITCYPAGPHPPRIELRVSDRPANLLEQPVDFALRYGRPEDSGMIALPVYTENRRILCASPAYLARAGTPESLADLRRHNCLRFALGDQTYSRWRFGNEGSQQTVEVRGDRIADDGGVVRQWALAGLGIAYKSELDVMGDIESGRLVRLLPDVAGEPSPLYLLAVSRSRVTAAIRRLVAYLAVRAEQRLKGPVAETATAGKKALPPLD